MSALTTETVRVRHARSAEPNSLLAISADLRSSLRGSGFKPRPFGTLQKSVERLHQQIMRRTLQHIKAEQQNVVEQLGLLLWSARWWQGSYCHGPASPYPESLCFRMQLVVLDLAEAFVLLLGGSGEEQELDWASLELKIKRVAIQLQQLAATPIPPIDTVAGMGGSRPRLNVVHEAYGGSSFSGQDPEKTELGQWLKVQNLADSVRSLTTALKHIPAMDRLTNGERQSLLGATISVSLQTLYASYSQLDQSEVCEPVRAVVHSIAKHLVNIYQGLRWNFWIFPCEEMQSVLEACSGLLGNWYFGSTASGTAPRTHSGWTHDGPIIELIALVHLFSLYACNNESRSSGLPGELVHFVPEGAAASPLESFSPPASVLARFCVGSHSMSFEKEPSSCAGSEIEAAQLNGEHEEAAAKEHGNGVSPDPGGDPEDGSVPPADEARGWQRVRQSESSESSFDFRSSGSFTPESVTSMSTNTTNAESAKLSLRSLPETFNYEDGLAYRTLPQPLPRNGRRNYSWFGIRRYIVSKRRDPVVVAKPAADPKTPSAGKMHDGPAARGCGSRREHPRVPALDEEILTQHAKHKFLKKIFGVDVAAETQLAASLTASRSSNGERRYLQCDHQQGDLMYNMEGELVGATWYGLMCKLTQHDQDLDRQLLDTVLLTFRSVASPEKLFSGLLARFRIEAPPELKTPTKRAALMAWQKRKKTQIQLRVFAVLKAWLETYFFPASDFELLPKFIRFSEQELAAALPAAGKQLLRLAELKMKSPYLSVKRDSYCVASPSLPSACWPTSSASSDSMSLPPPRLHSRRSSNSGSSSLIAPLPSAGSEVSTRDEEEAVEGMLRAELTRDIGSRDTGAPSALPTRSCSLAREKCENALHKRLMQPVGGPAGANDLPGELPPCQDLARQLTLLNSELYAAVTAQDLVEHGVCRNTNISRLAEFSTKVSGWVSTAVLKTESLKKRAHLLKYFVQLGEELHALNNFDCLFSVVWALTSKCVSMLECTWQAVGKNSQERLNQLRQFVEPRKNYSVYRNYLKTVEGPCVPYVGLFLSDLTFTNDGHPLYRKSPLLKYGPKDEGGGAADSGKTSEPLINYYKMTRIVEIIKSFLTYQKMFYLTKEVTSTRVFILRSLTSGVWSEDELYAASKKLADTEKSGSFLNGSSTARIAHISRIESTLRKSSSILYRSKSSLRVFSPSNQL